MNRKTKNLISKIENQIRQASIRFELLLSLWGSQENIATLNRVAGNVFLQFHNSLIETIVIGINRLCDPAKDGSGNKNLSLERLRISLSKGTQKNKDFQEELRILEEEIKKEVKKLNKFRNKRVAHNDYPTHAGNWHRKIPNPAIDRSLKMMEEFVSKIYLHFDNYSVSILDPRYPVMDGPDRLISQLKRSVKSPQN